MNRLIDVRTVVIGAGLIAVVMGGCSGHSSSMMAGLSAPPSALAQSSEAQGIWAPSSRASFAHLDSGTTYAIVYAAEADLIVIDQPLHDPRLANRVIGRVTWLIPMSMYVPIGTPVDFTIDAPRAYVIEALNDEPAHAVPAYGRVTLHGRGDDSAELTVSLTAQAPPPTAGGQSAPMLSFDRRMTVARRVPYTPQPEPPERR